MGSVRDGIKKRDPHGTGFLFEEPNPTGSRPSDLIGLYRKCHLFKRETEHLCLRPPIHGIGRDPFARE